MTCKHWCCLTFCTPGKIVINCCHIWPWPGLNHVSRGDLRQSIDGWVIPTQAVMDGIHPGIVAAAKKDACQRLAVWRVLRKADDSLARMVIVSLWPWCWLQGWQYWTRLWHTGPSLLVKGSLWQTWPWPPPLCRPSGAEIYWVYFQKFLICCSNNWRIAKVCSWWGVEVSASAPCSMVEHGSSSGEHNYVCGFFNKREMRELFHLTCDDCVLC